MKVDDKVATVFGIGYVRELTDTHAWIELGEGSIIAAPLTQVTVLDG